MYVLFYYYYFYYFYHYYDLEVWYKHKHNSNGNFSNVEKFARLKGIFEKRVLFFIVENILFKEIE